MLAARDNSATGTRDTVPLDLPRTARNPLSPGGFLVLLSQPDARPKGFEPLTFRCRFRDRRHSPLFVDSSLHLRRYTRPAVGRQVPVLVSCHRFLAILWQATLTRRQF